MFYEYRNCCKKNRTKVCFYKKIYLQNRLAHKIHIFCPIEINEYNRAENVNFVSSLASIFLQKTDFNCYQFSFRVTFIFRI